MKILLLEDVKGLGKKGDICEVKDGYGRNFLLAKKKAQHATHEVIAKYNATQRKLAEQEALNAQQRNTLKQQLQDITLTISKKGNNGTLFGSITKEEIALALQQHHSITIDKKDIDIQTPIKHIGTFTISINLGAGIHASLAIVVKEIS